MGPKTSDPTKIPAGKMEANDPAWILVKLNFSITEGRIEPRLTIATPNNNIPRHAAINTDRKLYFVVIYYFDKGKDSLHHKALPRRQI